MERDSALITTDIPTLEHLFDQMPGVKVGIIGDFCLDLYYHVNMARSEISLETGLPSRPVERIRRYPGGAGNVAANMLSLGAEDVRLFGVVGSDLFGNELKRQLSDLGADCSGLLVQEEGWLTHVYTKLLEGGSEAPRIDFGNYNLPADAIRARLIDAVETAAPALDVIIINQQQLAGIYTPEFRESLRRIVSEQPDALWLVDSRHYPDEFPGTIRKLNDEEAERVLAAPVDERIDYGDVGTGAGDGRNDSGGIADDSREGTGEAPGEENPPEELLRNLYERWKKPVILTRGEEGCMTYDGNTQSRVWGLFFTVPLDTVGAGDSLLAGAALALGAGASLGTAAYLGNLTAGVTVRKLHYTGTATRAEVMALAESPDFRYHPEKAFSPRHASYIDGSNIEIITSPPTVPVRYAIFDHDGTISTLRQGWEEVMKPVMIRSVLGDALTEVSDDEYARVEGRVEEFIEKTTGIQTLVQMDGLADMVRVAGYVSADKVLDAHGYKEIYNEELMRMIRERIRRYERGELGRNDFTLKKAVPFLTELADRGVILYLASGTDREDVRKEAEKLGYADLFGDRIFGAVGDITVEPKRVVLGMIIDEIGPKRAESIVTFGDGPVEMRETKKKGGFAVGVASDEVRRFGLNPKKRERLVLAGADLVIPDFSQHEKLLEVLF
jgi:sugar/nucleoside kinase (ribokinase family)/phosphoglycolate phosphatase-like HAD superfamily hydrolase